MSGPEVPVIQVVSAVSVPAPQRVLLKSKSWNNSTKPGTGKTTHGNNPIDHAGILFRDSLFLPKGKEKQVSEAHVIPAVKDYSLKESNLLTIKHSF